VDQFESFPLRGEKNANVHLRQLGGKEGERKKGFPYYYLTPRGTRHPRKKKKKKEAGTHLSPIVLKGGGGEFSFYIDGI